MKRSTDNLRHTRWECKYHVVFIPKYRKKSIYGWVRRESRLAWRRKSKALLQGRIQESFKIELAIICARTPTRRTGSQARS